MPEEFLSTLGEVSLFRVGNEEGVIWVTVVP